MTRHGIGRGSRLAAVALAIGLVLCLAGDGGRAATVPAAVNGQDPLEVLSLKVRPNVIVVLDSSGSMKWTLDPNHDATGDPVNSGDHPRSKLFQAKQVLKTIVQDNEDKASFLFGQYTNIDDNGYGPSMRNRDATSSTSSGQNRFIYWTSETRSPSMETAELSVERALDDTGNRGLQSWQIIYAQWNTLHFEEEGGSRCSATLAGPFPRFYKSGADLATALQTAMNGSGCSNTYTVSYGTDTGRFSFSATGGARFQLLPDATPNNISQALGGLPTGLVSPSGAVATPVVMDVTRLYRRSWGGGVDTATDHGLSDGDLCTITGADPTYWNGTWSVDVYDRNSFDVGVPAGWDEDASVLGTTSCTRSVDVSATSDTPYTLLFRADTPPSDDGTYGTGSWGRTFHNTFNEEVPPGSGNDVTNYQLRAARFFNGETIKVTSTGEVCGMTFPVAADRKNPPILKLQQVNDACDADVGDPVTFTWGGAFYTGGGNNCDGFRSLVDLVPCDLIPPDAETQLSTIGPWLDNEAPLATDGSIVGYAERMDGSWSTETYPAHSAGGVKGYGSTPIAASLADINDIFADLWNNGQTGASDMAGPAPYKLDPIKNHRDPKEKTIVLFITDGDDTCWDDDNYDRGAKAAAYEAEQLYAPFPGEPGEDPDPASSVETFVIGYGGGADGTRLDWISWGGSGLGQNKTGQPDVNISDGRWYATTATLADKRAECTTCRDAFIAPDAATLAATLQGIIDQGASSGDFSAQQSITESVYEYVDLAGAYDARSPSTRYTGIVPTRFVSTFKLPGFRGQLKAYHNDGAGNAVLRWDAGEKLTSHVSGGMTACDTTAEGGANNQCVFAQLHGGATDATIATSTAAIKRRIYTTDRNGVYVFTPGSLMARTPINNRLSLWPPAQGIAPSDYASTGSLDAALGLPPNSPTCTLQAGFGSCDEQLFAGMQADFGACVGSNLPAGCTDASASVRMKAARREARDIILAFMAGAETVPGTVGGATVGNARTSDEVDGSPAGSLLFRARSWVLADSELATAAVVTPPLPSEPEATGTWVDEYVLFRDGVRNASGRNPDTGGGQIYKGFGLRNPDDDQTVGAGQNDPRTALKPVMTVIYAPGNDMLHAFRAGPQCRPATPACPETGGEELWGFVPFDQLETLRLRVIHEPQGRDNHVYMIARGIRFSDVFVPAASTMTNVSIGGVTVPEMAGVWRRILYFGRGIAGKYVTALDVTAPGPYTTTALATTGPIPLWSRGNPDTQDGTSSGANNNTTLDGLAYRGMGETWSMPAVGFTDSTADIYKTTRRPEGVKYLLFMGSGYGDTGEGTTFYTLDALSGDVIAAVDVEVEAVDRGLDRSGLPYDNALVANAIGFRPSAFSLLTTTHPAATPVTRVYIGDIHGRLWKFLVASPTDAIPVADLGADQPIGTAVSLLGMPPYPGATVPYVFVTSGNERRAEGPFKIFAFRDDGTDTQVATGSTVAENDVTAYRPAYSLFTRTFDAGAPQTACKYSYDAESVFRGTVQPAAAFECPPGAVDCSTNALGRVFFAGTRLSDPNTKFAPPTPLACGSGQYPCRSQFDSIIYALGAETGLAAYDLGLGAGDEAYRVFRDSRIVAIGMQADPDPDREGASFAADEGLAESVPKPPPPPGVPPSETSATANVMMAREAGQPPPSVHYGSTVCQ